MPLRSALAFTSAPAHSSVWLERVEINRGPAGGKSLANPREYEHQNLLRIASVRGYIRQQLHESPQTGGPHFGDLDGIVRLIYGQFGGVLRQPSVVCLATITLDQTRQDREPPLPYRAVGRLLPGRRSQWRVSGPPGLAAVWADRYERSPGLRRLVAPLAAVNPGHDSSLSVGGAILLEEYGRPNQIFMVSWSTRSMKNRRYVSSNGSHAERQFLEWICRQRASWRKRISRLEISSTHSPCILCCGDLAAALGANVHSGYRECLPREATAHISWKSLYRDRVLGTSSESLAQLRQAGWQIVRLERQEHGLSRNSPQPGLQTTEQPVTTGSRT